MFIKPIGLLHWFGWLALVAALLVGCARTPDPTGLPATTPVLSTSTPASASRPGPTGTTRPASTPTSVQEPTVNPTPALATLRVALIKGANVWFWEEGQEGPRPLTQEGEVEQLRISDDGGWIAYQRQEELRAVRSDGSEDRALVTAADLAKMEPKQPGVRLYHFEWVPGTHLVAFNTQLREEMGLILTNDLYQVDVDTLERTLLLPPGEGGEFHYAPDGRQIAIVDPDSIHLVDADGTNRRLVLTYEPHLTYSEFRYYVQPVWSPDGTFLRVAIPPADPLAQPLQPTSVWHIPADGSKARLLQKVTTRRDAWAFSPDLRYLACLDHTDAAAPPPESAPLAVLDLESGNKILYEAPVFQVYGWSPDGQHVGLAINPSNARTQILNVDSKQALTYGGDGVRVENVSWVDTDHYLFILISPQGLGLYLAELGTAGNLVAPLDEFPVGYDLARAESAN